MFPPSLLSENELESVLDAAIETYLSLNSTDIDPLDNYSPLLPLIPAYMERIAKETQTLLVKVMKNAYFHLDSFYAYEKFEQDDKYGFKIIWAKFPFTQQMSFKSFDSESPSFMLEELKHFIFMGLMKLAQLAFMRRE